MDYLFTFRLYKTMSTQCMVLLEFWPKCEMGQGFRVTSALDSCIWVKAWVTPLCLNRNDSDFGSLINLFISPFQDVWVQDKVGGFLGMRQVTSGSFSRNSDSTVTHYNTRWLVQRWICSSKIKWSRSHITKWMIATLRYHLVGNVSCFVQALWASWSSCKRQNKQIICLSVHQFTNPTFSSNWRTLFNYYMQVWHFYGLQLLGIMCEYFIDAIHVLTIVLHQDIHAMIKVYLFALVYFTSQVNQQYWGRELN